MDLLSLFVLWEGGGYSRSFQTKNLFPAWECFCAVVSWWMTGRTSLQCLISVHITAFFFFLNNRHNNIYQTKSCFFFFFFFSNNSFGFLRLLLVFTAKQADFAFWCCTQTFLLKSTFQSLRLLHVFVICCFPIILFSWATISKVSIFHSTFNFKVCNFWVTLSDFDAFSK